MHRFRLLQEKSSACGSRRQKPLIDFERLRHPWSNLFKAKSIGTVHLCTREFEDKPKDGLATKAADFEAQMQALKDNGIIVISMEDFLAWAARRKRDPRKSGHHQYQ